MRATKEPARGSRARGRRCAASASKPRTIADLANVGPATLGDFRTLGIRTLPQLAKQDAFKLYERLCRRTGERHDPCCIDVFLSAIDQARGGTPRPWWEFTDFRKQVLLDRPPSSIQSPRHRPRRNARPNRDTSP